MPRFSPPPAEFPSAPPYADPPRPGAPSPAYAAPEPWRREPAGFASVPASGPAEPPAEAPARNRSRRLLLGVTLAVVVVLLAGAALVVTRPGPLGRMFAAAAAPSPTTAAPNDPPAPPVLAGAPSDAPAPTEEGMTAALRPLLNDPRLGGHVVASVVDVGTGQQLFGRDPTGSVTPASTQKLLTAAATLATRGPSYQIATRAVAGPNPGEVVLVGGGDPTLSINGKGSYPDAARLDQLATQVKQALGGTAPTRVLVDSSLYTGPSIGPGWLPADVSAGYVSRITPLMTDGARTDPKNLGEPSLRYAKPDLAAGQAFAKLLGLPASAVSMGVAEPNASPLGEVKSPPVIRLIDEMLSASDNVIAEMLARQVALARNQPASFAGATSAIMQVLGDLRLPTSNVTLVDGSGLSTRNRLTPALLTSLLTLAASPDQTNLRGIFTALPVAAWSGTLKDRYQSANTGGSAAGTVRAKTGTLDGVNALAGVVVDADGRLLAFAVLADATPSLWPAEMALDRVAAAVARCGCR
ncbi:MAG TPA: D-alanyl-D-alanine carboxypeptidase/D-alanyl-D-alanine-endopeptidase [Micromonosporaceae bacterium]